MRTTPIMMLCAPNPASPLMPLASVSPPSSLSLTPSSTAAAGRRRRPRSFSSAAASNTAATDDTPSSNAWPCAAHPSPYDIFGMSSNEPYTKRRFYQLVKLYHPDTQGHHPNSSPRSFASSPLTTTSTATTPPNPAAPSAAAHDLSPAVCLERYRLIVAANALLSDPGRRQLYDTHGIGWPVGDDLRQADRDWRHRSCSAANNATWEDWERWRHGHHHNHHRTHGAGSMHMGNTTFAALVVAMCIMGAVAQANRAEASGAHYLEMSQQRNAAIGQEILKTTMASAGRSKDERVDCFLRDRASIALNDPPTRCCNDQPQHDKPA